MIKTKNIIPVTADGLLGEPLCVSPCGCLSTRLDESSFSLFVGSIFLFSVDFLVLRIESK